ncbi:MAG: hypothetical protein ACHQQ3_00240 [Gemmatimonadales bacterium]
METDRPSSAGERAEIAWIRASDSILRGLNHAFSNQLSLIRLLSQFVREGEVVDAELAGIAAEAAHLDVLLGHYRLLPFAAEGAPEPIRVLDVTNDALALFRYREDARDRACTVEGDPDTSPVLLNPAALTQAVTLLLCAAARMAGQGSGADALVLRYGGDAEWVRVAVEVRAPTPPALSGDPPEIAAVRWLIRDAEGSTEVAKTPSGGSSVGIRIGTLRRLRQRAPGA